MSKCKVVSSIDGRRCIKEEGHLIAHQWESKDGFEITDIPEYLAFQAMVNIRELKKLQPDHWLVQAVENAADDPPVQLKLL